VSRRSFEQYFCFDAFKPTLPAVRRVRCNDRIRWVLAQSRDPVRDADADADRNRRLYGRRRLQYASLEFRARFDGIRRQSERAREPKIFGEGRAFAGGSAPPARSQLGPACIGKTMTEYVLRKVRQSGFLMCISQNYAFLRR
jgi:hypothetical protein